MGTMMKIKLSDFKILFFCGLVLATAIPVFAFSQQPTLKVVKKMKVYRQQIKADSNYTMVEIKSSMPSLQYDLRYATAHNFTGQPLYKQGNMTFLRRPAATALQGVQAALNQQGLGLKIFDAYRPYSTTRKMWELIQDERYVANPAKGSGHNRGLAVDVTIIELASGKELNMGTGFDHFSDTAHHSFKNLDPSILQNRNLLKQTMEAAGFKALETEWWHYSWPNDRAYEVLDLDFTQFSKHHIQQSQVK